MKGGSGFFVTILGISTRAEYIICEFFWRLSKRMDIYCFFSFCLTNVSYDHITQNVSDVITLKFQRRIDFICSCNFIYTWICIHSQKGDKYFGAIKIIEWRLEPKKKCKTSKFIWNYCQRMFYWHLFYLLLI